MKTALPVFRLSFLLFFLITSAQTLQAQYTISGKVTHAETGNPLPDVEIYNDTADQIVYTDEKGEYILPNLYEDTYRIYVLLFGFKSQEVSITITNSSVERDFQLHPLEGTLEEITLVKKADQDFGIQRLREVEGTSIFAGKKNNLVFMDDLVANVSTNNARQIYSQVAGLNIYESISAGLQLNIGGRGLDPNRSANFNIRQNNYDISADVLGYPESYYTPPAEALKRIQIVRGAASLQYGTQFGGLVNFIMKEPTEDKKIELITRNTMGSNALLNTFNSLGGTIGNFSYYGYVNVKQGDGFRPNSEFDAFNTYIHTQFKFTEDTKVTLEYTHYDYLAQQPGGLTDFQFYQNPEFSNRERNWFEVDWNVYSINFHHHFTTDTELDVNLYGLQASRKSVGFRTNRVSQVDDPDEPRDLILGDFNNIGAETRLLHRYTLKNNLAVALIGAKYYQSYNEAIQGPGTAASDADFSLATETFPNYRNQSDFDFPNLNLALFGEHIFYIGNKWSITPGFRLEYIKTESEGSYKRINFDLAGNPIQNQEFEDDRSFDRSFVLLGLGSSYYLNEKSEIYANFSQNYRSVTFNDIRIVNPTFQIDPNIKDEVGFTVDAGIRGQWRNIISYDAGVFGMKYDDRIGEVLRAEERVNADGELVETGRIVRFRGNIGNAFIYGVESLVDWNLINTFRSGPSPFSLNIFLNTAFTASEYLDSKITGVEGKEVEFIPKANIKTGLRAGFRSFKISAQYTYLSDQYTDANNFEQNKRDNQGGIRGAIPAYDVVDLSMAYTYKRARFEAGINNLLDNDYFTRRATGYPGPGIIPSAPRTYYFTLQITI